MRWQPVPPAIDMRRRGTGLIFPIKPVQEGAGTEAGSLVTTGAGANFGESGAVAVNRQYGWR